MRVYRPDIDGLRALAVGLVVLYHVGFGAFSGGYVGVDVFFVISGYLITANIIEQGQDFRFGTFYIRRIRRLFPAALTVIALTLLASAFILDGDALRRAARSGIAAIPSLSNFVFWLESGYWDSGSELKPLLHTWSLAVEEQFYLFWPFFIVGLAALKSRWAITAGLAVMAVGGVILAEWAIDFAPGAAFYLTPFRATEFALGGLYAAVQPRLPAQRPVWLSQILLAAGLALILFAGFSFTEETRFPGLNAWIPCVGTVLVIAAGRSKGLGWAFDNPVSIYLGRISYSLYLTHWPIMALWRYHTLREFHLYEQWIILALTLVSAVALFHLIETPLRNPHPGDKRKPLAPPAFLAGSLAGAYLVTIGGAWLWAAPPAAPRPVQGVALAELLNQPMESVQAARTALFRSRCEDGRQYCCMQAEPERENILVIGNSHGTDGYNIMVELEPDANIIHAGRAGCEPLINIGEYFESRGLSGRRYNQCLNHTERVYGDDELIQSVDTIVFSFRFNAATLANVEQTMSWMRERTAARIVLFGNGPVFEQDLPLIVRREGLNFDSPIIPPDYIDPNTFGLEDRLRDIAAQYGAEYISKTDVFCPEQSCSAFQDGDLITYDAHHLSAAGAAWFARQIDGEWNRTDSM